MIAENSKARLAHLAVGRRVLRHLGTVVCAAAIIALTGVGTAGPVAAASNHSPSSAGTAQPEPTTILSVRSPSFAMDASPRGTTTQPESTTILSARSPSYAMKAAPTVKATPYWGEPQPR